MAGGSSATRVVQITNIAPQATKDQMQNLFGHIGKIEEIRLYPTIRDVTCPVVSRICYVKYQDPSSVAVAQHMTNTVFIDRALIVIPVANGIIPDEYKALEMSHNGTLVPGLYSSDSKLPPEVVNRIDGMIPNQVVKTSDPKLDENNLPEYPALPVNFDARKIEETRRTILVLDCESDWRLEDLMDHFKRTGEVKYARFAESDRMKIAMIEFCEQKSIISALKLHGSHFMGVPLNLHHSTQPIIKPEAKSNEAAQREIEEAMSIVKEAQNMISAAIDPVIGLLSKDKPRRRSRSRSRSRKSRSRSRERRRKSRSRSSDKRSKSRRKSRSRTRDRSREKSRKRSRSRSRKRSRSRDRHRRRRSRSRHRSRSRSRERRRRNRSKSRHRSRSRSSHRDRKRSHRKDDRKSRRSRTRSKSRHSSRSKESSSKRRSRSRESKLKKISEERVRDYDAEEKIGLDDNGCEKSSSAGKSDNMDISP